MKRKLFLAAIFGAAASAASAQLSGSVSVEGEYEPLVIETERLNTFPAGYRFELPASSLSYESEGVVTDFRPDLLTMGVTGRLTDWPWRKRRGYADLRLGSYLDSRVNAGYYILADKDNTLLADLHFSSTAYRVLNSIPFSVRNRLFDGSLGLHYRRSFGNAHTLHADADGSYTAFREGAREGRLKTAVGYAYTFSDHNTLGIDAQGDFLFPDRVFNNYGVVSLCPAYRFADGRVSVKAGVDLSLAYDAMGMEKGEKFNLFHIAPDVAVEYRINPGVGVFVSATGGVTPSTLSLLDRTDPFWMPWLFSPQPVYSPADVRGGVEIGPFYGFAASLALRYAVTRNVPLEAWRDFAYTDVKGADLHGIAVDCNIRYAYGSIVELSLDGTYTPQHATHGLFNGFDRPRWVLDAKAAVRPVKKLKIELGYGYRGVRNCYGWSFSDELETYRLPDITDLNAKITFSLLDNLDIYCKGQNLLNRHTDLVPSLCSEGIAISGGLYIEF